MIELNPIDVHLERVVASLLPGVSLQQGTHENSEITTFTFPVARDIVPDLLRVVGAMHDLAIPYPLPHTVGLYTHELESDASAVNATIVYRILRTAQANEAPEASMGLLYSAETITLRQHLQRMLDTGETITLTHIMRVAKQLALLLVHLQQCQMAHKLLSLDTAVLYGRHLTLVASNIPTPILLAKDSGSLRELIATEAPEVVNSGVPTSACDAWCYGLALLQLLEFIDKQNERMEQSDREQTPDFMDSPDSSSHLSLGNILLPSSLTNRRLSGPPSPASTAGSGILTFGNFVKPPCCPYNIWNKLITPCLQEEPAERVSVEDLVQRAENALKYVTAEEMKKAGIHEILTRATVDNAKAAQQQRQRNKRQKSPLSASLENAPLADKSKLEELMHNLQAPSLSNGKGVVERIQQECSSIRERLLPILQQCGGDLGLLEDTTEKDTAPTEKHGISKLSILSKDSDILYFTAAAMIQSVVRGNMARKEVANIKAGMHRAAVMIQSLYRGHNQRKVLQEQMEIMRKKREKRQRLQTVAHCRPSSQTSASASGTFNTMASSQTQQSHSHHSKSETDPIAKFRKQIRYATTGGKAKRRSPGRGGASPGRTSPRGGTLQRMQSMRISPHASPRDLPRLQSLRSFRVSPAKKKPKPQAKPQERDEYSSSEGEEIEISSSDEGDEEEETSTGGEEQEYSTFNEGNEQANAEDVVAPPIYGSSISRCDHRATEQLMKQDNMKTDDNNIVDFEVQKPDKSARDAIIEQMNEVVASASIDIPTPAQYTTVPHHYPRPPPPHSHAYSHNVGRQRLDDEHQATENEQNLTETDERLSSHIKPTPNSSRSLQSSGYHECDDESGVSRHDSNISVFSNISETKHYVNRTSFVDDLPEQEPDERRVSISELLEEQKGDSVEMKLMFEHERDGRICLCEEQEMDWIHTIYVHKPCLDCITDEFVTRKKLQRRYEEILTRGYIRHMEQMGRKTVITEEMEEWKVDIWKQSVKLRQWAWKWVQLKTNVLNEELKYRVRIMDTEHLKHKRNIGVFMALQVHSDNQEKVYSRIFRREEYWRNLITDDENIVRNEICNLCKYQQQVTVILMHQHADRVAIVRDEAKTRRYLDLLQKLEYIRDELMEDSNRRKRGIRREEHDFRQELIEEAVESRKRVEFILHTKQQLKKLVAREEMKRHEIQLLQENKWHWECNWFMVQRRHVRASAYVHRPHDRLEYIVSVGNQYREKAVHAQKHKTKMKRLTQARTALNTPVDINVTPDPLSQSVPAKHGQHHGQPRPTTSQGLITTGWNAEKVRVDHNILTCSDCGTILSPPSSRSTSRATTPANNYNDATLLGKTNSHIQSITVTDTVETTQTLADENDITAAPAMVSTWYERNSTHLNNQIMRKRVGLAQEFYPVQARKKLGKQQQQNMADRLTKSYKNMLAAKIEEDMYPANVGRLLQPEEVDEIAQRFTANLKRSRSDHQKLCKQLEWPVETKRVPEVTLLEMASRLAAPKKETLPIITK